MLYSTQHSSSNFKVLCFTLRIILSKYFRMKAASRSFIGHAISVPCSSLRYILSDRKDCPGEHCSLIVSEDAASSLGVHSGDLVLVSKPDDCDNSTSAYLFTNSKISNNDVLLSDTLLFNAVGDGYNQYEEIKIVSTLVQELPTAAILELTLLRCPNGWEAADVDLLLAGLFSKPRVFSQGDVFPVEAAVYAPRLLHSHWDPDFGNATIWFQAKVLTSEPATECKHSTRFGMWVKRGVTQITLGPPTTQQGVPSYNLCPPNLENSLRELKNAAQPFLAPDSRRRPPNGNNHM